MNARDALLGGAAAIALGAGLLVPQAGAQVQIQQTGTKADAATFFSQSAGGRTTCSTTQDTVANETITITPPAGNYVYLTGVYIEVAANATAASSATLWTSTNLTGSPTWLANVTASSASVPSGEYVISEMYPTGLRSQVAGTAVTILPTATSASTFQCAHAVGYFSPS
jgi:hypothetical protein